MPRKRRPARKPVPKSLKSPLKYKIDIVPKVFGQSTPEAEAEDERYYENFAAKIRDVFNYYDIDPTAPTSITQLLMALIEDRFPDGFRPVPEGAPVAGRKPWPAPARVELIAFIRGCMDNGYTREGAAELYAGMRRPRISTKSVLARYDEFSRWAKSGRLTAQECLDLLEARIPNGNRGTRLT